MDNNELICKIHESTLYRISYTYKWKNGKAGGFVYDEKQNCYRFVETNDDLTKRVVFYNANDLSNFPIKAKGFTSFLIHKWETVNTETDYYEMYYTTLLEKYKKREQIRPNTSKRNLDKEFYTIHIQEEKKDIDFSQSHLFEFLSVQEKEVIQSYINNYLAYVRAIHPIRKLVKNIFKNLSFGANLGPLTINCRKNNSNENK